VKTGARLHSISDVGVIKAGVTARRDGKKSGTMSRSFLEWPHEAEGVTRRSSGGQVAVRESQVGAAWALRVNHAHVGYNDTHIGYSQ